MNLIRTIILEYLADGSNRRRRLDDIAKAARQQNPQIRPHEVARILGEAMQAGLVELDGGLWRITSHGFAQVAPTMPASVVKTGIDRPIPSAGPVVSVAPAPALPGRWSTFRRLLAYYRDCLVQEDAPEIRGWLPSQDEQWLDLSTGVDWAGLDTTGTTVPLKRSQGAFLRSTARMGEGISLYLGYPIELAIPTKADVDPFIVPLFFQAIEATHENGCLRLTVDGPPQANPAWLEFAFKTPDERTAFRRDLGLLGSDDPVQESAASPTLATLAQGAGHWLGDRIHGSIVPGRLDHGIAMAQLPKGIHNRAVLMLGPRMRFTRSLMRELAAIGLWSDEQLDQTALRFLFPDPANVGKPWPLSPATTMLPTARIVEVQSHFPAQRAAVQAALTVPLSVITGPPGTGKSTVARSILLNQMLRGRSSLFASRNHRALDAVVPVLNQLGGAEPLMIRAGGGDFATRSDWKTQIRRLLSRPAQDRRRAQSQELKNLTRQLATLEQHAHAQAARADMAERLTAAEQAVQISREGLPRGTTPWSHWQPDCSTKVAEVVSCYRRAQEPLRWWDWLRPNQRRSHIERWHTVADTFPPMHGCDARIDPRPWVALDAVGRLTAELVALEACASTLDPGPDAGDVDHARTSAHASVTKLAALYAGGNQPTTGNWATTLSNLRAAASTWGDDKFIRELTDHLPLLLETFPLWAVSNLSIRSVLPLAPGALDLVVIDEASQCDIPSIIPLLARSRRAVFIGDPLQLRHITHLTGDRDAAALQANGLSDFAVQRFSYRVNAAYDLAASTPELPAMTLLDVHLRCHDDIASYASDTFYRGQLLPATDTTRLRIPAGSSPGITWQEVSGEIVGAPGGGCFCQSEIDAVVQWLVDLAKTDYPGSVGVVTPFRQQAQRLQDRLERELPSAIHQRWQLLTATAHGFQGDERDLIIYSLCAGPGMPKGSAGWFASDDGRSLVNVAVTRARAVLMLFGNRSWALSSGLAHLERLARPALVQSITDRSALYESIWEERFDHALTAAGLVTYPQHRVAQRRLDLAVLDPIRLDIEIDGEAYHRTASGHRKDDDVYRDVQLMAMGWAVLRFWVYELREDMPTCVERVRARCRK